MGRRRTGADVLSAGGCSWRGLHHENGASWHPTVEPWGEMKCVTCLCKVSQEVDGLTVLQTAGREHRLQEETLRGAAVPSQGPQSRPLLPALRSKQVNQHEYFLHLKRKIIHIHNNAHPPILE